MPPTAALLARPTTPLPKVDVTLANVALYRARHEAGTTNGLWPDEDWDGEDDHPRS